MALAWKAGWVHALAGSNPASSAPSQHKKAPPGPQRSRRRFCGRSLSFRVSVLVSVGLWRRPEEPADSARDLMPDGLGYVLVARGHRRRRPAHHAHDCAFRHLKGQEHGCSCVPGVVQSCFSHARPLQQRLPGVIVGVRLNRAAEPVREDSARLHPELTSPSPFLILFAAVIFYELDELGRQSDLPLAGTGLGGSIVLVGLHTVSAAARSLPARN
jgi:hypothetical protein